MTGPTVDEPIAESAPLAHGLAREHCRPTAAGGESCAWYHGFWQHLRLMGLTKTSGGQGAFLVDRLRRLARSGQSPRVLVSGSADYSMPAHALAAYRAEGAALDLVVLDRCETPLALSRWYAARQRVTLSTHCADVLDPGAVDPADVVFTNSFLGSFDPASRPRLVASWRQLLRPGGSLLFTNRLRPRAAGEVQRFDAAQARGFVDAARREATERGAAIGLPPEEAARRAQAYAERYRSHPVRSVDEITALLETGGFAMELLEVTTNPGREGVSGPSMAERADYARVVAIRR